jgi:hypothetical protein
MQKIKILIALLILLPALSFAQTYVLKSNVIDEGGEKVTSSNYICQLSIAQYTASEAWIESPNYMAIVGFWNSSIFNGIEEDRDIISLDFSLYQNYPNPVTSGTYIEYSLPITTKVTLKIYDVMGRNIRNLVDRNQNPGSYKIYWDSTNRYGEKVSAGIYFYQMKAGEFSETKKMIIMR